MALSNDLLRIEQSLRAAAHADREHVPLSAFDLFVSSRGLDHLTFATPHTPDPDDWAPHVEQLLDAFHQHRKRERLEFIADLHPGLAPALEAAGLQCEMRAPLMALDVVNLPPTPSDHAGARYVTLEPGGEGQLRDFLLRQGLAFSGTMSEGSLDWLPGLQKGLREGTIMAAALEQSGMPVTGAVIVIGAGIGELAGVWTDPDYRRRGLAFALCHRLLSHYAAAGYTFCWLSSSEDGLGLYERLGFEQVGTQLNYGAP